MPKSTTGRAMPFFTTGMITGPKYKIARRLGAPIFEKTQTQKYALHLERRGKKQGFSKQKTEYGVQMNEKQKARFTYGLSERQFSNYVKEALGKKSHNVTQDIFEFLECRLDNVIYRIGFSTTRLGSRQIVSHGHITVNGKKVDTPSLRVKIGDIIGIRQGSLGKTIFKNLDEREKSASVPSWIQYDGAKKAAKIQGKPMLAGTQNMFDLNTVIEFYSR